MNISSKINLAKLNHAITKTKKGSLCIMIPLDQRGLFYSEEKGNVYLDTVTFIKDEVDIYGNNGAIALSKKKDSDEETLYVGNCKILGQSSNVDTPNASAPKGVLEDDLDLPF